MNVGDIQTLLTSLGGFLAAHQGVKLAKDFETFCSGLEPFKEMSIGDFAKLLREVAEKPTDAEPHAEEKKPRGGRSAAKTGAPKGKPKTKDDTEAIQNAVSQLQALYDRYADPTLTQSIIETEVERINGEFDTDGLKVVARTFGIAVSLGSKRAAKQKILERIVERKGHYERSEAFSAAPKPTATEIRVPAEPPGEPEEVVAEVVE
jgi:hypothetical protein